MTTTPQHRLARARRAAHILDDAFRIPVVGWRVGLDPLLSVAPVSGDLVGLVLSLYVVLQGGLAGASLGVVARMLCNVALDAFVGSIPVVGTLFDAVWKANDRNVALLEAVVDGD